MIKFCTLFSGSSGNSTFIGTDHVKLLVDAGSTVKGIERELKAIGEDPSELDAVLVTHEHTDHTKGAGALARKYGLKIIANRATWSAMEKDIGNCSDEQCVCFSSSGGATFALGDLDVEAFPIPHDADSPVGYSFTSRTGRKHKVAVATDIGHVTGEIEEACFGSRAILIEANHDIEMLENGPYPRMLKARIKGKNGHLSNDSCAGLAAMLAAEGTDAFVLGHLSEENNEPDTAYASVRKALETAGNRIIEYGDVIPPEFFGEDSASAAGFPGSGKGVILSVAPRYSHGKVILL